MSIKTSNTIMSLKHKSIPLIRLSATSRLLSHTTIVDVGRLNINGFTFRSINEYCCRIQSRSLSASSRSYKQLQGVFIMKYYIPVKSYQHAAISGDWKWDNSIYNVNMFVQPCLKLTALVNKI
jgi:hypothetical protein